MPALTLEQLDKCWNEGPFCYTREHDSPLGWSCRNFKTGKTVIYGDKNLCCGLALMMNGYEEQGLGLIKSVFQYFK